MQLYSIALPTDLNLATSTRFRKTLAEAVNAYADLSERLVDSAFRNALAQAIPFAADTPSLRAWAHTIACLAHPKARQQQIPTSSLVGHLHADGPTAGRLLEQLGWEGLGATCDAQPDVAFDLPSAPPTTFAFGKHGAFHVIECWPTSGRWRLSVANGQATLLGPGFAASSTKVDNTWTPNLSLRSSAIDAFIPLSTPALVNRDFQEFPMVRSRCYGAAWASIVVEAAEVIRAYSESAAACAHAFVRCVVPLVGGDEVIGSASREEALGLIFLPASNLLDQVVECLLHETMHQYLFRIEECGDLFSTDTDAEDRFYSPWRSDPRPLRMTLHGAFVFAAVADLYLWDRAPLALKMDRRECVRRAYHRAKQVRIALDVVYRHAKLMPFGKAVIDAIENDLKAVFDRACPNKTDRISIDSLLDSHMGHHAAYAM